MATLTVKDTGEFAGLLQPLLGTKRVALISPNTTTTVSAVGTAIATAVGTISNPALASTDMVTQARRIKNTSSATAGNYAEIRGAQAECWRGSAAGLGGFMFRARFALETLQTGMRSFVGLADVITAMTNYDPTTATTPGKVGFAINVNGGNWKFVHNTSGATPTVIDLGADIPVSSSALLEFGIYCAPNSGTIFYRALNVGTGVSVAGSGTTNLPANTSFLDYYVWATNNATAASVAWGLSKLYLESGT